MRPTQTHSNRKWPRHLDAAKAAFETHCGGIRLPEKKTTGYQEQDRQKAAAYQEAIKDIRWKRSPMWMKAVWIHICIGNISMCCRVSRLLKFWFSNQLLPFLEQGTVIVMDNASFHSQKRLLFVAPNAGCRLLFLPLEHFWVWLKCFLRKILPCLFL